MKKYLFGLNLIISMILLGCGGGGADEHKDIDQNQDTPDPIIPLHIDIDLSSRTGDYRDLLGVMKSPLLTTKSGQEVDLTDMYRVLGISEVRTNDDYVDICKVYTDDNVFETTIKKDFTDTCKITEEFKGLHHMVWRVNDKSTINSADNYDFSKADRSMKMITDAGAKIYLRLGESWLGPNDTDDADVYATVASNIYKHYLGAFKPIDFSPEVSVVEIHNEADGGMFWNGERETYQSFVKKSIEKVKALKADTIVGGSGFVHGVSDHFEIPDSPLYHYIENIGKDNLDFFSAHFFGECENAQLDDFIEWYETLGDQLDIRGMGDKPFHLTAWNIGTATKCALHPINAYREPHFFSFVSGFLLLIQKESLHITHAHFYAGHGSDIALFSPTYSKNQILISKSFLAFYLHKQFVGMHKIETQICDKETCNDTYDTVKSDKPLLAQTYQDKDGYKILIINDSNESIESLVNLSSLPKSIHYASSMTYKPPASDSYVDTNSMPSGMREIDMTQINNYIQENVKHETLELSDQLTVSLAPFSAMVIRLKYSIATDTTYSSTLIPSGQSTCTISP